MLFGKSQLQAQELFPFTEPASNMPSRSLSAKFAAYGGVENDRLQQRYVPELMWGVNKKWMLHAASSFSNMHQTKMHWESAFFYAKYRFFSNDAVHQHFRVAAFATGGYSKNAIHIDELNVQGENTGFQTGVIATQLINKVAFSGSASFLKAVNNPGKNTGVNEEGTALNVTLSSGYLLLPKEYVDFNQLNVNLYTEILGQKRLDNKTYYVDVAPAIQFIFKSNSKLNIGYRFPLAVTENRSLRQSFLLSFEHTFFNVFKKK